MLYIWNIEKIIQQTLSQHNLKINYESSNSLTVPMSYNVSHNTIRFNYLKINGYIAKLNIRQPKEDLVRIVLYRVLGYYLDFKKNKHDTRILMYGDDKEKTDLKNLIEKNAWIYGRTLVPGELISAYDRMYELDKVLL
ncbi:hypothetical protein AS034_18785 [[Bacillus] enclensis]|uniref:Uncharacterized protein n=2 Tax=Rossellomorea TaxID=2837508 RepID=A0A0V8HAB2_9BACI|nr:hypothetical protein [[Bacillus] enclensis]OAT80457.1 hypothetical protein A6P54_13785 [Bacillus sp. MKU004]QWC22084.1 hypothetical protein KJK41_17695 [Bacillus haikouensis]KSU59477.1 hypothetical protein AS034_18785 [[Bacillus] enclensis]MBH9965662.1 hypothetical protein [[Bacillus] enclensis]SCC31066.1 hypothetical protein GA0061094_3887 [[Bacillus] enclensis]